MTDKLQRPESFEFALDFLGIPGDELRAYIEQLEARAALAAEAVAVSDRLPELRGMFERILCVARSSDQKPVGNIELADRLIKAVVSWAASGAALAAEPVAEPAPPAEGEVGELVAALELEADAQDPATELQWATHDQLRRAADLLEQRQAAPVPVAVSEKWPEFSDCDAQERLWCSMGGKKWELRQIHSLDTHWLPATALPLPQGEVEE